MVRGRAENAVESLKDRIDRIIKQKKTENEKQKQEAYIWRVF